MAAPSMLVLVKANIEALKAQMKEGSSAIAATTAGAAKLASSLDGSKLEQRAQNMVVAIQSVGGAFALSDKQAQASLKTLDAYIDKATRMGKEIPPSVMSMAESLKRIEPPISLAQKAGSLLQGTIAQFTVAGLATNAISSLTSSLMNFADIGINKLPAVQASYNRLTASMKIDSAAMLGNMNTATKGLVSNYDLMLSANKAMLLGLPVTSESMGDLAKTASILGKAMGQDATTSLNDLITALGRSSPMILDNLGLSVKVGEANEVYAAKLGKVADALTDGEKKMAFYEAAMEAARKKTTELGEQTRTLTETASALWARIGDVVSEQASKINNAFGPSEQQYAAKFFAALHLDTKQAADDFADLGRGIETALGQIGKLPKAPEMKLPVGAGVKLPNLSIAELLEMTAGLEKENAAHLKATEAANKHAAAIDALFKKYSGADANAQMKDLDTVFRRLATSGKLTRDQIDEIVKEAINLQKAGATLTPQLYDMARATDALAPSLAVVETNLKGVGKEVAVNATGVGAYVMALAKLNAMSKTLTIGNLTFGGSKEIDIGKPIIPKAAKESIWAGMFGSSSEMGQHLAQTLTGAFQGGGDAVKSGISAVGSMVMGNLGKSLVGTAAAAGPLFNSALGKVFAGALPVIGSMIGPLASAIWNKLFGTAGRDAVKDFAATFKGGFDGKDGLHEALNTLGAEGERLWIKLTQGTGKNNPAQAKATIEEITAALAKQKEQTAAVAAAAAESAAAQQAALDAISEKYSGAISKLESEYKSLSDSVSKEAAEEFMGIGETQERERMKQIAAEKEAQIMMRDAEIAAKTETFDATLAAGQETFDELRRIFGQGLDIPTRFGGPNAPSGSYVPSSSPTYRESGGSPSDYSGGSSARASSSDRDQHFTLVMPDGDVLLKHVVRAGKRRGWMT